MKIGIITDIHSNIQALTAVLNEFDKIGVDKIICCGDIIGIGINPEETVKELIKRKDKLIAVRGNHEQYLINGLPKQIHDDKRKLAQEEIDNHNWNHSQLSQESINFLRTLKVSGNIEICGKKFYIVHYPIKEDGTYKKHIKNPTIIESKEMFKEENADIYLYGHTHTFSVNNEDGKWYINVGALGCPMNNSNIARAGILEISDSTISFNGLKVEYNVKEVINEIYNLKIPFYRGILKIFYGQM
ncbi:MAG: metallophosphoesterase family protein [Clostridia bacterium]|nr:metallophosphoesterase family protein [Clostridia bacterium]